MPDSAHSEEIVELVDEDDQVIGTVPVKVANLDPTKIHREVAIMVADSRGRLLLQKRSQQKDHEPGLWTMAAAGHIPVGMTPLEGAHAELQEELGFDTELQFVEKYFDEIPTQRRFIYLYIGTSDDPKLVLEPSEVDTAEFVDEAEAIRRIGQSRTGMGLNYELAKRFFAGEFDQFLQ